MLHSNHPTPPADAPLCPHPMAFHGKAGEYFKIWMANLLLTILTLGIYSAWAKVRNRKYLYGSTQLEGANFDYTANPLSILIGRAIIVLILFGGALWAGEDILRIAAHSFLLVILLPWALVRSYAFNARYTTYRNVAFSFITTRRVFAVFYLIYAPLILLTIAQYVMAIYTDLHLWHSTDLYEPTHPAFFISIALFPALLVLLLPQCVRAAHRQKGRHTCWGVYQADFAPAGYPSYFTVLVLLPLALGFVLALLQVLSLVWMFNTPG